jgi:anaerobic selenocysteine-containing dehydrogenase
MMLMPENYVEMNASDASTLGIESGDLVTLTSPSNTSGIQGRAKVTQGLRPGVIAVSHSYGHWQNGAAAYTLDGVAQDYDASRGRGIQANLVMRLDSTLGDVSLQDKIGGSCSFYDTWVNVTKVG